MMSIHASLGVWWRVSPPEFSGGERPSATGKVLSPECAREKTKEAAGFPKPFFGSFGCSSLIQGACTDLQVAKPETVPSFHCTTVIAEKVFPPLIFWYFPAPPVYSKGPEHVTVSPSHFHVK